MVGNLLTCGLDCSYFHMFCNVYVYVTLSSLYAHFCTYFPLYFNARVCVCSFKTLLHKANVRNVLKSCMPSRRTRNRNIAKAFIIVVVLVELVRLAFFVVFALCLFAFCFWSLTYTQTLSNTHAKIVRKWKLNELEIVKKLR